MARFLILITLLGWPAVASAVIEVEMPLEKLVGDSEMIVVGRVDRLNCQRERATIVIERTLKGDAPFERCAVLLRGSGEGHPLDMQARIKESMPLVLFITRTGGNESQVFAYAHRSWFKLRGFHEGSELKCSFVQGEPNLAKTFQGEVAQLEVLLTDFLAGRGQLPPLDKQAQPALGPTFVDLPHSEPAATELTNEIELGGDVKADESIADAQRGRDYVVTALLMLATALAAFMLSRSRASEGVV